MRAENLIEDILTVIGDCNYIQESSESDYTKKCAKISAYDEVSELVARFMAFNLKDSGTATPVTNDN